MKSPTLLLDHESGDGMGDVQTVEVLCCPDDLVPGGIKGSLAKTSIQAIGSSNSQTRSVIPAAAASVARNDARGRNYSARHTTRRCSSRTQHLNCSARSRPTPAPPAPHALALIKSTHLYPGAALRPFLSLFPRAD
jgi:hypothetical protein